MFKSSVRRFSSSASTNYKVTVLGAGGGIGQPLSLLLKLNKDVTKLSLYDLKGAPGVAADVSHIPTNSVVTGYTPENDGLAKAVEGSDIVLIPAGIPRKPGMTRDDLFNTNASIVAGLVKAVGTHAPNSLIAIISNPVNSTVPIAAQVLKSLPGNVYNPKKLFGVTTLDSLRASRFISQIQGTDPANELVPVVGGHSGVTIVPLLSQSRHPDISGTTRDELVHRIQFGGDEVVKAKAGAGSATLSMAQAASRFAGSLIKGLKGESDVIEASYVDSPLFKDEGIDFFASRIVLGKDGVKEIKDLGKIDDYEADLVEKAKETLKKNIAKGYAFAGSLH